MARPASELGLSLEAYLEQERSATVKHEYAAGHTYAMAGASERHNRIAGNLFAALHRRSLDHGCTPFISDMRVAIDQVVYYPDLMVCCEADDSDPWLKRAPCLVIEILSESTERIDRGEKLYNYRRIPTLRAYLLVAQDAIRVEVYRRHGADDWRYEVHEGPEARIALDCPPAELSLAGIYERIAFPG
jgi:Uma2 family endonuclease